MRGIIFLMELLHHYYEDFNSCYQLLLANSDIN